jgi:hypothetical protein
MNLQFSKSQIVDRFNFDQLTENQQLQFLVAGRNAWGFNQPLTLLEIFSEGEKEEMSWEYYQITDNETNTHLYDAWILADDSGTVFYANSPQSTEVEMCQSYFDSVVSDDSVSILAEQIGQAYKKCRQAFDDDEGGYDSNAFKTYWDDFFQKKKNTGVDEKYWNDLTIQLEQKLKDESK